VTRWSVCNVTSLQRLHGPHAVSASLRQQTSLHSRSGVLTPYISETCPVDHTHEDDRLLQGEKNVCSLPFGDPPAPGTSRGKEVHEAAEVQVDINDNGGRTPRPVVWRQGSFSGTIPSEMRVLTDGHHQFCCFEPLRPDTT